MVVDWIEAAYEHIWLERQSPTEEIHNATCLAHGLFWTTVLIRANYGNTQKNRESRGIRIIVD